MPDRPLPTPFSAHFGLWPVPAAVLPPPGPHCPAPTGTKRCGTGELMAHSGVATPSQRLFRFGSGQLRAVVRWSETTTLYRPHFQGTSGFWLVPVVGLPGLGGRNGVDLVVAVWHHAVLFIHLFLKGGQHENPIGPSDVYHS